MSNGFETEDNSNLPGEERRDEQRRDEARSERRRDDDYDRGSRGRREERDDDEGFSLADLGRQLARPTLGGVADAALATLVEAFENAKSYDRPNVPAETKRDKFHLLPMDSFTAKIALPSLAVVLPVQVQGREFALTYILLCEQPGEPQTRTLSERGESYDALILPSDNITDKFLKIVKEQVASIAPGEFVNVGNQVILADTIASLTEKDSANRIARIFDNALDAICGTRENIIDNVAGKRDATVRINPKLVKRGDRLEVTFDYSGKQLLDSSGLPIRSDVKTDLYYSSNTRDGDDEDLYSRTAMGYVTAGLDLMISDEAMDEENGFGGRRRRGGRRDDRDEPFWQAILNVTSINSAANFPFSLELAQMLLGQVALQSNDYRWATILRPRTSLGGDMKPLVNLGHLFLMHPDPEKACIVDDLGPNSSDADIFDYLDETVSLKMAFGMTVPSSGEKSSVLSIFEQIATSPDRRKVDQLIEVLYDSADTLTDGRFRQVLNSLDGGDLAPVKTAGTRQFVGTWVEDGKVRSLAEWNVPAVCTRVGAKNPEMVKDYQISFDDQRSSIDFNLSQRYSILKRIVPGLHVVDTSEQLVFNPAYIHALAIAMDEVRMSPHVSSAEGGMSARRRMGNSAYSSSATADIGVARRRRDDNLDRGRGRQRRGWNDYY